MNFIRLRYPNNGNVLRAANITILTEVFNKMNILSRPTSVLKLHLSIKLFQQRIGTHQDWFNTEAVGIRNSSPWLVQGDWPIWITYRRHRL